MTAEGPITRRKHLSCPSCKATLGDGTEFTAQQQIQSFRELIVVGFDPYGDLAVEGVDHSFGDPIGPLRIACGACRHEWPTKRQQG